MQLRYLKSALVPKGDGPIGKDKATAVAWSPNGCKLAVCTVNGVVTLFDERGEEIEKFSTSTTNTKSNDCMVVRGLAFSPSSDKLGVAQSNCIVFVYKLGLDWGGGKSICNKFVQPSPVTGLSWPVGRANDLVFGLMDGKVRAGQLKTNSSTTLYGTDSYVAALACSPDGNGIVSAHIDGSIHRFFFGNTGMGTNNTRIVVHPCVPYAISWGRSIVAAGNDGKVIFYDINGGVERAFDYGIGKRCKEFTVAASNSIGSVVVIGNFNSFYIFCYDDTETYSWVENGVKHIDNMFSVTALSWKTDGSQLAVGGLCGMLDIYEAYTRHLLYKDSFELLYDNNGQVIVKRLGKGEEEMRIVLKSRFGYAVKKVNIFQERFLVAHTDNTLILRDSENMKISEVPWQSPERGKEKYLFDHNPNLAIVIVAGELSVAMYGRNEIIGSVFTTYVNKYLISIAMGNGGDLSTVIHGDRSSNSIESQEKNNDLNVDDINIKLAYLLDLQTICVRRLGSSTQAFDTINHDYKIDWLELNEKGTFLLFRDKRLQLHCFNLCTLTKRILLNYCTYVQWVPNSDVVVAQCRTKMCIWYNIHAPDQVTLHEVKGNICDIARSEGRTEVYITENFREVSYLLDEALIGFSTAIQGCHYFIAIEILERLHLTPEAKAMWQYLGHIALTNGDITIAQKCSAALGDMARVTYLQGILDRMVKYGHENNNHLPMDHWWIQSHLNLLNKRVKAAEDVFVSQGHVSDAVDMHVKLHDYENALALARRSKVPSVDVEEMSRQYFNILLDSGQDERAALLKEKEGGYEQAIELFLRKGLPVQAARILDTHVVPQRSKWRSSVVEELIKVGGYDQAGAIYEQMDQLRPALQSYVKGNAFRKAIDLARRSFPNEVVELEECWGDYLVQRKQVQMAIDHYIKAGASIKAINACFESRQFVQAAELIDALDDTTAQPYFKRLAHHYKNVEQFQEAERYFFKADTPQLAVEMYCNIQKWDAAGKLATSFMSKDEVQVIHIEQATRMKKAGKLRDAEYLYLRINEIDSAIGMYKEKRIYDEVIRLVSVHRPESAKEIHHLLAEQFSNEGALKNAEHHFVDAGEWLNAIHMYSSADMWEDAIRVAKYHGGPTSQNRVAYAWALSLGECGTQRLREHGLLEPAIEYALEIRDFRYAFELARAGLPSKLQDIHLKNAMYLEDEERFQDAEAEFILAGKPHEAVEMYMHHKDWQAAIRVAESHDHLLVSKVLSAQAKDVAVSGRGELLTANEKTNAVTGTQQYQAAQAETGQGQSKADYIHKARIQESAGNWSGAIDTYLEAQHVCLENQHDLEDLWGRAIAISRTRLPNHLMGIVREVSHRLCDIQRHASAAKLLAENGQLDEAVMAAISGEAWETARKITCGHASLKAKVEDAYQHFMVHRKEIGKQYQHQLAGPVETVSTLDILAQHGKWDELLEKAEVHGIRDDAALGRFALIRLRILFDTANLESTSQELRVTSLQEATTTQILEMCIALPVSTNLPTYENLTKAVLRLSKEEEFKLQDGELLKMLENLRKFLRVLFEAGKSGSKDIEHLLMATHYSARLKECILHSSNNKDCSDIAARMAITLLRYVDIVPADKAFYQAGILCREIGEESLALLLLNRYIDLTEAIEERERYRDY